MTVERAYRILQLPANASEAQLLLHYRKLVKRCHPDYNSHRSQWAHAAMTRLNLAYETAQAHLRSDRSHSAYTTGSRAARSHARAEEAGSRSQEPHTRDGVYRATARRRRAQQTDPRFRERFTLAVDRILDGMYLYYQYGLENVHLRHEGVRRFRYRSAVKQLKEGVAELRDLESLLKTEQETEQLKAFTDFSKAFLQNMLITKYYIPSRFTNDNKAYKHYANGSAHLDHAIKNRFFGELVRNSTGQTVAGGLNVSYHEFMTVLVRYAKSTWIPETVIKIYLLEVFTKVSKLEMAV